ncbi:permease [Fibrobacterales bacterium]|nr:permease [Fibrobacterales bacterium]
MSEEMAPSLLFGVLVAGFLKVFMPTKWVQKRLSGTGLWASVKASLLGVPLPLCSCSVLPVAAHFRKSGATKTSTLAFLGSTPATGVDSMMATYGMLGPGIAIIRPVLAFFSGVFAGWIQSEDKSERPSELKNDESSVISNLSLLKRLQMGVDYSVNDVIPDLRKWLIIGLLIGAFIEILLPSDSLSFLSTNPWLAYGIVLAIGIPLYTCSTGSIPIALALMSKGLSPGAVVIFLAVGPTMSTASLGFVGGTFGRVTLFKYVGSIALVSLLVGVFVDWIAPFWSLIDVGKILHNHHAIWEFGFYSLVTVLFWMLMLKEWALNLFSSKKEDLSNCGCSSESLSARSQIKKQK